MLNQTMLWFIAIPIALGLGLWWMLRDRENSWVVGVVFGGAGILAVGLIFLLSSSVATHDTEIWNGKITSKDRVHGSYVESYQCNCRTVTSGSGKNATSSTVCDTCYRDHYTVDWTCNSTIKNFTIDHEDWLSRAVYLLPNPGRWALIKPGDPVSTANSYTNYVQAVPESLFTPSSAQLKAKFAALVPAYPINIYDVYHNDHFVSPGYALSDAAQWNADLANGLRDLGPSKQVNAIVVVVKTDDPNYEYALRDGWTGAKKNDVVLIIGSAQYPKIDFVRVISWTKNELFKVELRDAVLAQQNIDRPAVLNALFTQISKNFERRHMKEFEYLKAEIDPPQWLLILTVILLLGAAYGTWHVVDENTRPRRY